MTRTVIESVINEFLDSKTSEVLAISGQWGVGKTYTLREMVRDYDGWNSLAWYSYISVFGAKSITLRGLIDRDFERGSASHVLLLSRQPVQR